MQEIHSIGGGSRLFNAGGGGGGGDRRLRPQNHQSNQALKCPRCDSLNTKFCYYNNYNLSQPRHFCKSCRRYWTKGGVLRNVPVGGGCRKTKRSNKPKQTNSTTDITTIPPPEQQQQQSEEEHEQQQQRRRKSSNSHSSSESSSLTATNTAAAAAAANNTALEVVSAHSSSSVSNNLLNGINESKQFGNINSNSRGGNLLEQGGSDCGIFSEIGSFTSLITATNDHLGFGFSNLIQPDQNHHWQQPQQQKIGTGVVNEGMKLHESMAGGYIDQTVQIELSELQSSRSGNNVGGFGTLDWQGTGGDHQGLFDLPNAVDQNYWNQSQWTDQDQPSLYLP